MGKRFYCTDWEGANAILLGGRDKDRRVVGNNRTLIRSARPRHEDSDTGPIALELHSTDVVTYWHDGTCTIYMGGWDSVITKQTINQYSPARVHSVWFKALDADGVQIKVGVWHEKSNTTSPPKIWKCRTCHGTTIIREVCHPGSMYRWHDYSRGDWENDWKGRSWRALPGSSYREMQMHYATEEGCSWKHLLDENGKMFLRPELTTVEKRYEPRRREVCDHGFFEPHFTYRTCGRCDNGRRDYGSHTIPTPFWSEAQLRIGPDGAVLGEESEVAEFLAYKAELVKFFDYRATIVAKQKGGK